MRAYRLVVGLACVSVIGCAADTFVTDGGVDGSTDAALDESGASDGGGGTSDGGAIEAAPPARAYQCNGDGGTCDAPQICCNGSNNTTAWGDDICHPRGDKDASVCAQGWIECNDSRDCPLQLCCANINLGNGALEGAECASSCETANGVRLCGSVVNGMDDAGCPGTTTCQPLLSVPWLFACQPP